MKTCSKCKVDKDLSQFYLASKSSGKVRSACKFCTDASNKLYHGIDAETMNEYYKSYRRNNLESVQMYQSKWYADNKGRLKKYEKDYRTHNKDKINTRRRDRRSKDPLYKLQSNLRTLIFMSLKAKNYKKSSETYKLLGADFATVQQHLIDTAIKNYGAYNEKQKYHIDHIIPCSVADNQDELETLQFYYNLQYLTPEDNLAKSDKLDGILI